MRTYTPSEVSANITLAHEICDRIYKMRRVRAETACRDAGIGHINMCVIHNAFVAFENGQPWPEINYSALRLARRILNDFTPSDITERYYRRMYQQIRWN